MEELRKEALRLTRAMGERPTVAEIEQVLRIAEELTETGYWRAHMSVAGLYRRLIKAKTDWGQSDKDRLPPKTKAEIRHYATLALLHLNIFYDLAGEDIHEKVKQKTLDTLESWRQDLAKDAQIT